MRDAVNAVQQCMIDRNQFPGMRAANDPVRHADLLQLYQIMADSQEAIVQMAEAVHAVTNELKALTEACDPTELEQIVAHVKAAEKFASRKEKLVDAIIEKGLTAAAIAVGGFVFVAMWEYAKKKLFGG